MACFGVQNLVSVWGSKPMFFGGVDTQVTEGSKNRYPDMGPNSCFSGVHFLTIFLDQFTARSRGMTDEKTCSS